MKKIVILMIIFCFFLTAPGYSGETTLSTLEENLANTNAADAGYKHGLQNTAFVVLRSKPQLESEAVAVLPFDVKLKLLEKTNGWVKVTAKQGTGYMRTHYFREAVSSTVSIDTTTSNNSSTATPTTTSTSSAESNYKATSTLKAEDYGYGPRYQPVYDIAAKFCQANQAYVLAKGHTWQDGYASRTDCSGFTGSFYQKLADASGVAPTYAKNSWYPTSTTYKTQNTKPISTAWPPPNPRDLIKPGDIFVMNKGAKYGHVGVFMGYDKSGNPLIAHSTTTKISSSTKIMGNNGLTGVRIERLPSRYKSRWAGIYRINGTDKMLDKLSGNS